MRGAVATSAAFAWFYARVCRLIPRRTHTTSTVRPPWETRPNCIRILGLLNRADTNPVSQQHHPGHARSSPLPTVSSGRAMPRPLVVSGSGGREWLWGAPPCDASQLHRNGKMLPQHRIAATAYCRLRALHVSTATSSCATASPRTEDKDMLTRRIENRSGWFHYYNSGGGGREKDPRYPCTGLPETLPLVYALDDTALGTEDHALAPHRTCGSSLASPEEQHSARRHPHPPTHLTSSGSIASCIPPPPDLRHPYTPPFPDGATLGRRPVTPRIAERHAEVA